MSVFRNQAECNRDCGPSGPLDGRVAHGNSDKPRAEGECITSAQCHRPRLTTRDSRKRGPALCPGIRGELWSTLPHHAHPTLSRVCLIRTRKTFSGSTELTYLKPRLSTKQHSLFLFILRPFAFVYVQALGVRPVNQTLGNSSNNTKSGFG